MANNLIYKKEVDMSVLRAGMSIPAAVQERVYEVLGHRVLKRESYPIKLIVDDEAKRTAMFVPLKAGMH